MTVTGFGKTIRAALAVAGMIGSAQAHAQDVTAIEALAQASQTPTAAIASAREQAAAGDLTGAAATLERALLGDRQANTVRMAYAALLCRLDDAQGARAELAKLDGQPSDDTAWAEVQAACGTIQRPTGPTTGGNSGVIGEIAVGVAYDGDALNALTPAFGAAPTKDGLSFVASMRFEGRTPTAEGYLYGGLRALTKDSFSGPAQDYQLVDGRIGYSGPSGKIDFSVGAVARYGLIGGTGYVSEIGGQTEIGFGSGPESRIAVRGEAVRQDYKDDAALFERSGGRYDLALSWSMKLKHDGIMVLGGGFELKDAPTKQLGYTGGRLFFGIHQPIADNGLYFDGSSTLRYWDHHNATAVTDKKEWRGYSRAALGLPIGPRGLAIEAAVSHSARDYNTASLLKDYSSFGGEFRLVYRFGQGGER